MSTPQPVRRSGVPLFEVGLILCAVIGIAGFIWWGLQKSRETARRGVARTDLEELGFTIEGSGSDYDIRAIDVKADKSVLNLICVFDSAKSLSLHNSWIDGEGLKQISESMTELETLELPDSKLTDEDFKLLTAFPELKHVSLQHSLIKGHGLKVLGELSNVESFNFSDNELTDDCRRHFAKTEVKTQLILENTWLSEAAIAELRQIGRDVVTHHMPFDSHDADRQLRMRKAAGQIPPDDEDGAQLQLLLVARKSAGENRDAVRYVNHPYRDPVSQWLRLSGIRLLTSELELIQAWGELRFMDLTSLHVAGITFYQHRRKYELPLGHLAELETLSLAGTGVGDHALTPLAQCRSLRYLDLRMTDLYGNGLEAISELPKLEILRLSHNMIEDVDLRPLAKLKSLKRLELDSTDISDAGLATLAGLSNLKELSLSRTRVTKAGIEKLRKPSGVRITTDRPYDPPPQFQKGPALRPLIGIADGSAGRSINKRREAPYTEELIRSGFAMTIGEDGRAESANKQTDRATLDQLRHVSRLFGLTSLVIPATGLTEEAIFYLSRLPKLKNLTLVDPGISHEHIRMLRSLKTVRQVKLELQEESGFTQSDVEKARESGLPFFLTPVPVHAESSESGTGQSERSDR